jgi:hypothetical protein
MIRPRRFTGRAFVLPTVAVIIWVMTITSPAWAHGDEVSVPAGESFATAMALLQVQPDMTDMIGDKIGDGLESDDTEGVDLSLARQAQKAYDAGNNAEALDLLAQATGLTPGEALAMQTEETDRPSEVPLADQLGTQAPVGRPSSIATAVLGLGAVLAIGLGIYLSRRTR